MSRAQNPILTLVDVCKAFSKPSGEPLAVLADINVALKDGEILGLLGRSGSGKSTLLRIAAGLMPPSSGEVLYRGERIEGPHEGIAVVFQTFALFPWLTVLENVEAGLDALGLDRAKARSRAQAAIDLIGLDGFQDAYPRELSGGMRQRVGFARAFVINPVLLLMDEPFSALDVLTAETLRTDLIDLWTAQQLPTNAILIVTHNIEEAVLMCDRILVLSSNPGRIAAEIPITLPQPRDRLDSAFRAIVDEIYATLTGRAVDVLRAHKDVRGGIVQPLPRAAVNRLTGLMETLFNPPYRGSASLGVLARALSFEVDDLLPLAEALHILEFAELNEGALKLTAPGRVFAGSTTEKRKLLFNEHLLRFVPLAAHIRRVLKDRESRRAPRQRFETELEDHLTRPDAEQTLSTIIGWARYAELFSYDARRGMFTMAAGTNAFGSTLALGK